MVSIPKRELVEFQPGDRLIDKRVLDRVSIPKRELVEFQLKIIQLHVGSVPFQSLRGN